MLGIGNKIEIQQYHFFLRTVFIEIAESYKGESYAVFVAFRFGVEHIRFHAELHFVVANVEFFHGVVNSVFEKHVVYAYAQIVGCHFGFNERSSVRAFHCFVLPTRPRAALGNVTERYAYDFVASHAQERIRQSEYTLLSRYLVSHASVGGYGVVCAAAPVFYSYCAVCPQIKPVVGVVARFLRILSALGSSVARFGIHKQLYRAFKLAFRFELEHKALFVAGHVSFQIGYRSAEFGVVAS